MFGLRPALAVVLLGVFLCSLARASDSAQRVRYDAASICQPTYPDHASSRALARQHGRLANYNASAIAVTCTMGSKVGRAHALSRAALVPLSTTVRFAAAPQAASGQFDGMEVTLSSRPAAHTSVPSELNIDASPLMRGHADYFEVENRVLAFWQGHHTLSFELPPGASIYSVTTTLHSH